MLYYVDNNIAIKILVVALIIHINVPTFYILLRRVDWHAVTYYYNIM